MNVRSPVDTYPWLSWDLSRRRGFASWNQCRPFFAGLLPEEAQRQVIAGALGSGIETANFVDSLVSTNVLGGIAEAFVDRPCCRVAGLDAPLGVRVEARSARHWLLQKE